MVKQTQTISRLLPTNCLSVSESVFFLECAKMYFYTLFLKEPPGKYLNFIIKENMRGECAKDETFRNAFSRTLVIIWSLVILS